MANMDKIKDKLALLPAKPGCYLMKDADGKIIYVGKAVKLSQRVHSYFHGAHDYKTTKLVQAIDDFEYITCNSEKEALLMEINLIKEYSPQYNIMFMDDKSYPYIKLSKSKAPMLSVVRNNSDKKATYYGPFPDSKAAYETKDLLNKIFPLRKCKHIPKRPCLYYDMGQCLAPCIREVDEGVYAQMAQKINKFLRGDTKEVVDQLKQQMMEASEALEFERAQELHEQIQAVEYTTSNQNVMFKDQKDRDAFAYYYDKSYLSIQGLILRNGKIIERALSIAPIVEEPEEAFVSFLLQYYEHNPLPQEILLPQGLGIDASDLFACTVLVPQRGNKKKLVDMAHDNAQNAHREKFELVKRKDDEKDDAMQLLSRLLNKTIHTIELYDNSHIQGQFNVSGMVVYKDGLPLKKEYRLYKLHGYRSDLDSMQEVVYRRYVRLLKEKKACNDLLLVDGGYLQIQAVKEVLDALGVDILLAGLVKDDKHRTANLMDENGRILDVPKQSSLFFLLTQMQDEVHRYAITYHQKLRQKAQTKSILEEVEGLGPKRQKALWAQFKSMKNIKEASIEELAKVVPQKVAQNVYETLHTEDVHVQMDEDDEAGYE